MTAILAAIVEIWNNKRIFFYIGFGILLALIIWWYGFHNPSVIASQKKEIAEVTAQRDTALQALTLIETIQKAKGVIDVKTFQNISTIRAKTIKPNTILVPAGRLLPPLR